MVHFEDQVRENFCFEWFLKSEEKERCDRKYRLKRRETLAKDKDQIRGATCHRNVC